MRIEDVETVARMDALDHDPDPETGYKKAKEHTLDHLRVVPQHCYVVEGSRGGIIGAMVLHPRDEIFEIEDFHVRDIKQNKRALSILKKKLMEYLATVETEILCCPYAMRRLMEQT
jgi:hypothetical protein